MKISIVTPVIIIICLTTLAYSDDKQYTLNDVVKLVPAQTGKGWWHKQVSTMQGNRYLSSFESKDHKGKLGWSQKDLKAGKIPIVKAMALARQWTVANTPFGEQAWEIENVTYRFRSGNDEIEYICAVTLKTVEYKTIEIIVLPNHDILPPVINPQF